MATTNPIKQPVVANAAPSNDAKTAPTVGIKDTSNGNNVVQIPGTGSYKNTTTGKIYASKVGAQAEGATFNDTGSRGTIKTTSAPTYSPAVITSSTAKQDLGKVQDFFTTTKESITGQTAKTSQLKEQTKVQEQQAAEKATADKLAADTLAIKKKESEAKNAALTGGSTVVDNTKTETPTIGGPAGQLQPATDTLAVENSDYQRAMINSMNESTNAYQEFKNTTDQLRNGSFPLSPAQQALVDGTSAAFDQMTAESKLRGLALSSQTGGFSNKVTQTLGTLSNIETQKAAALARMETGFQESNYKLVSDAYNAFTNYEKQKNDALTALHNDAVKQANDLRQYNMDVTQLQQSAYQFGETMTENKKQNAFDRAYKLEDLALKQRANDIANQNLNVPAVGFSGNGSPDPVAQKNFLASLPPATATMVKNLAAYTANPANLSARIPAGQTTSPRQQMIELAHQYDPTYDESQYAARAQYNKSLQSGTLYQANLAANKAINHLTSFDQSVSELGNLPGWNWENAIKNIFAPLAGTSASLASAHTESTGVSSELAKFFKGTGASDVTSVEEWAKNLDVNNTPENQKGMVQAAVNLLEGQLSVMEQQYRNTMGKAPGTSLLLPETLDKLSTLKDKGYTVNVPGVYYKDPVKYTQSSPDNAAKFDQVKKDNPDLTPAQVAQQAQFEQETYGY